MKTLLGILPFAGTAFWSSLIYYRNQEVNRSWRWSLALGCMLLGAFSMILTELLSCGHLLSSGPEVSLWSLFAGLPLCLLFHHRSQINRSAELARIILKISSLPIWALSTLLGTLALIVVMGVASPPLNFDVQIYHLPRQVFWMMQGSVEPFAASHTHQVSMPVLSEFLGLNLLILSGGDSWHNLVQTLFLLASLGIVTLIARSLGATPRAQILSLIFVVLVPVIFFEASNAKNDIILSLYLLIPLTVGINIWTGRWKATLPLLLLASLSAGLALATKGTAIAYLIGPALLIILACLRNQSLRPLLLAILPGLILTVLPAAPQILRNMQLFHSPEGPNLHHSNLRHDPLSIASVAVRNAAGQFTCGSESWNLMLERETRNILSFVGQNADDPGLNLEGLRFHLPYYPGLEDIVPAPVQTTLLLLLPLALLIPSFRKSQGMLSLLAVTFLSFLIFCVIFRWQPWQGRLLIPVYFMAAPMAGIILDRLYPRWLPILFVLLEIITLKPHLMYAGQHPLLGGGSIFRMSEEAQMSRMMPGRAEEIKNLAAHLRKEGVHRIMVDGGATEIYGLLREIRRTLPLISISSGLSEHPLPVDAIITTTTRDAGVPPPPVDLHPPSPPGFKPEWIGSYYRVFIPTPSKAP